MNKHFAIFDMDGTLVDSMGYWLHLGEEYLCRKGIRNLPPDLWGNLRAMTIPQSAVYFIRQFGLAGPAEKLETEMRAIMAEHYQRDILLKPGVSEYLAALRSRGTALCVATNTPAPLVRTCLRRLGIREMFRFYISCEEVGAGKDRPDIYLAAAARLGSAPEDTAVFEDALFAVRTAKAAGFYVVGVSDRANGADWDEISRLSDETVSDWRLGETHMVDKETGKL